MKRAFAALLLLLAAGLLGARLAFHVLLDRPAEGFPAPTELTVESGRPFGEIARDLEHRGLVPNGPVLALWARWQGLDRRIFPGTYLFEIPLTPRQILARLHEGSVLLTKVTIPEGLRASEIASILAAAGLGTVADYERLFDDPDFLASLDLPAPAIEGYLFPDTYLFAPATGPRRVLLALTRRFHEVFDEEMKARALGLGMTVHDVVTLASVVEKETGLPEERPLIASVFRNRLEIGMPLQSDPTVIYGIEEFDGNLTRDHLRKTTPYNTYTNPGLPPGPIASPGRESIVAVVDPAESDYLYFVSRNDGSHEFNRTLAEHNRAVHRFQRSRAAR